MGGLDGLRGTVSAQAITCVAIDVSIAEEKNSGVAGAYMNHQSITILHAGGIADPSLSLQVDEAGHLPVIEDFQTEVAGDLESIEKGFAVVGLGQDIACDCTVHLAKVSPGFAECSLKTMEDLNRVLGGGPVDVAVAENITGQGKWFLKEFDLFSRFSLLIAGLTQQHGDRTGPYVNSGVEVGTRRGSGFHVGRGERSVGAGVVLQRCTRPDKENGERLPREV